MSCARISIALLTILLGPVVMAIEEPEFEVLFEAPGYEVRRYAPYIVAEVSVTGDYGEVGNTAFRILAAYIFGENIPGERMEMTAPVESRIAAPGTRMAMTAPVISSSTDKNADTYRYGFVMERKYTLESLPEPKDPRIEIRRQLPRVMAVRKYSGRWTEKNYERNESTLLAELAADGIELSGAPVLARYNSPFTPSFLRRNEVMVEIEWHEQISAIQ
jgi:hypothetical protein